MNWKFRGLIYLILKIRRGSNIKMKLFTRFWIVLQVSNLLHIGKINLIKYLYSFALENFMLKKVIWVAVRISQLVGHPIDSHQKKFFGGNSINGRVSPVSNCQNPLTLTYYLIITPRNGYSFLTKCLTLIAELKCALVAQTVWYILILFLKVQFHHTTSEVPKLFIRHILCTTE